MANETIDPSLLTAEQRRGSLSALGAEAIDLSSTDATPSLKDPNGVAMVPRGLYLGTAGTLKVDLADGTTFTFHNLAAGIEHAIATTKVYKSGSDSLTDAGWLY